MTPRRSRPLLLIAAALALAAALSACGRRGPLELPPEVQAQGAALKAQQDAERARTASKTASKTAPGTTAPEPPPLRIPGTIDNRPPAQYPFPLDPLL